MKQSGFEKELSGVRIDLRIGDKLVWEENSSNGDSTLGLSEKFKQAGVYSGISRVLDSGKLVRLTAIPPQTLIYNGTVDLSKDKLVLVLEDNRKYGLEIKDNYAFLV